MPLTRYQIRNEYSLADPELYKAADRDDPEAILEGVAMAGLVGVLRQLGDLAEFAAEIFHDLHEEVMATAARGHSLMVRVQQLEAEVPSIEKAFLSQTNHSAFFSNAGVAWHPNLRMEQNMVTRGDLPRCVMDSYEECRGPPRLFLLDKFDVAGAGACLKRYTDPSFFKVEAAPSEIPSVEVQREKKIRKVKKKGSRWKNGETPEIVPTSHAKLHQLFLEEKIEKGHSDPARLVKLKKRQLNASPFDSRSGKSYMEKFLETTPEHNVVREISVSPLPLKMTPDNFSDSGLEIHDISTVSPVKKLSQGMGSLHSSPDAHEEVLLKPSTDDLYGEVIDRKIMKVPEPSADGERNGSPSILQEVTTEKEIVVDEEGKPDGGVDGDNSDDMMSEVDNYMDALTTMESEMETDNEYRPKIDSGFSNIEKRRRDSYRNGEQLEFRAHSSDSQSIGNFSVSDDGGSSFKKGRSSISYSDTLSNLAENTPSDGEGSAKVFPSEASVSEIRETSSKQLHVYSEVLGANRDLMMPSDICIAEDNICDRGEASGGYSDMDSNASALLLQHAESSWQHKLDETPSETMKPCSELTDIDERETNLADSSAVISDMSSQTRDTTLSTLCSENHPMDKLDGGDANVASDALLHLSNNPVLVPEKKSCDDSSYEVLQKDFAEENSPESMVNNEIGSPKSITSPKKEQAPCSTLPEVEVYSGLTLLYDSTDVGKLDDLVSKVDDAFLETGVYQERATSMVDTSENCSFKEQPVSGVLDNHLAEKAVLYSEEANLADTSMPADSEKIGVSTCKVEAMEGEAASLELTSHCTDSAVLEDHAGLDDVVAESVQAENMTVSTTATVNDHIHNVCPAQDVICSPSDDLVNLQEFPSRTEDPAKERSEINQLVSPKWHGGSEAENEMNQLEVAPKDFESASSKLVSYEESNLEILNGVHNLSLADTTQHSLPAGVISIPPTSSEFSGLEMESEHPHESRLLEDGEDGTSSSAVHLVDPDFSLQQSLELQADQLDVGCMSAEASYDLPTHLSEQVQPSNNGNQERLCNDESCQEDFSSQTLLSECLRQSTGLEINNAKQETDPFGSFLPSFGLLHEDSQVNLEEMPPLPPLPPMQWRSGKIQQTSLVSPKEFTDHNQESFPSILPFIEHEKAHSGFPSEQRGTLPPFNPFLPVNAVEVDNLQQMSELEEGNAIQPTPSLLQLPSLANDANSQKNNHAVEGTQSLNPFLTLSASSNEKSEHSFLVQSIPFLSLPAVEDTTSRPDPVSSSEKLVYPLNQLSPEPALEGKALQHKPENSEGEHVNTSDMSVPPLQKVEEQPQHGLTSSVGESACPSNPFAPLPTIEVGKESGSSIVKLPRPWNPIIDAVAALDKSKLRKVTERIQPQIGPQVDERDSLLEQIRTKSFNLKPAVVSRPSIQGPKTNLRVAAILEKANAIRQATAGSDEDDDEDSWSDC